MEKPLKNELKNEITRTSFMMKVRSVLLILFSVAIPTAAIVGASLPDVVKRLRERQGDDVLAALTTYWDSWTSDEKQRENQNLLPYDEKPIKPPENRQFTSYISRKTDKSPSSHSEYDNSRARPVAYENEHRYSLKDREVEPFQIPPSEKSRDDYWPDVDRLTHENKQASYLGGEGESSAREEKDVDETVPEDRFSSIQKRLRHLGATYYLLETWGEDGSRYRFHCRMAVGGSSQHSRKFEATASDPLGAMGLVLQKVENWKSGRN